ncbi:MAG: hypothetical protein GX434_04200 [Peptococcaceae bacterium]|nr:hypothetical protein [Peptococcaceae bacterium]
MSILDDTKNVAHLVQEAGDKDLYGKMVDLEMEVFELVQEIEKIKKENAELHDQLKIKEKLKFEFNSYWIEKNGRFEGPFCSKCYDVNHILVRMHLIDRATESFKCPNCATICRRKDFYQKVPLYDL